MLNLIEKLGFIQKKKIVSLKDIFELNDSINEKLKNHNVITNKISVILTLDDNKTIDFEAWETFRTYKDWHKSKATKTVTVTWDFSIQLPEYRFPQRHTVKVRIGSKPNLKEIFELALNHDNESQILETVSHSICSIDFINPVISSEIFLIIEGWHKLLPANLHDSKLYTWLKNHESKIEKLISYLILISGCAILFALGKIFMRVVWVTPFDQLFYNRIFGGLLFSAIFLLIMWEAGKWWARKTSRYIDKIKTVTLFNLTKGDENTNSENKVRNESLVKSIGIEAFVTIIFSLAAFFSGYLWSLLYRIFSS